MIDFGANAERIHDEVVRMLHGPRAPVEHFGGARPSVRTWQHPAGPSQWEYAVKTLEGGSDTWAQQLTAWRNGGWELLAVVPEGEERRAILERRI